jgi:hypothetical protein
MYHGLRKLLGQSEYVLLQKCRDRDRAAQAYRDRYRRLRDGREHEKDGGMRRIDFLMENNRFGGLSRGVDAYGREGWLLSVIISVFFFHITDDLIDVVQKARTFSPTSSPFRSSLIVSLSNLSPSPIIEMPLRSEKYPTLLLTNHAARVFITRHGWGLRVNRPSTVVGQPYPYTARVASLVQEDDEPENEADEVAGSDDDRYADL